jgi:hypothetical protein
MSRYGSYSPQSSKTSKTQNDTNRSVGNIVFVGLPWFLGLGLIVSQIGLVFQLNSILSSSQKIHFKYEPQKDITSPVTICTLSPVPKSYFAELSKTFNEGSGPFDLKLTLTEQIENYKVEVNAVDKTDYSCQGGTLHVQHDPSQKLDFFVDTARGVSIGLKTGSLANKPLPQSLAFLYVRNTSWIDGTFIKPIGSAISFTFNNIGNMIQGMGQSSQPSTPQSTPKPKP